jgi:hypothetical protein
MAHLLKKIFSLTSIEICLFFEACILAIYSKLIIFIFPTHIWINFVKFSKKKPHKNLNEIDIIKIFRAMRRSSVYLPFKQNCLVETIVVKKMLARKNTSSTLFLGVAYDDKHQLEAHAWLIYNDEIIVGKRGQERFTVVNQIT